jgi:hypothetical protein
MGGVYSTFSRAFSTLNISLIRNLRRLSRPQSDY